MPLSQDHHDLFHQPTVSDHLNLFQSLLDTKDLTSEKALALHNIIRTELERPQQNRSVYRRYSQVMESLHREMPEVYEQVVNGWQEKRQVITSTPRAVEAERTPAAESEAEFEEARAGIQESGKGGPETSQQEESQETLEKEGEEPEEETEKEETEKEEKLEEEREEETEEKEEGEEEKEGEKEERENEEETEEEEKGEEEVEESEEPEEEGAEEQEEV